MSTIKQVAIKAGVSPTTVSNVLNGNISKVSPDTKKKVEAILRQENYAPNMGAHILATKNSRIIGVIMFMEPRRDETVLEDPFSSTILGAIEVEIRNHGYFMMLHTTSDEEEVLRLSRTWKLAWLVLLFVPSKISNLINETIGIPVVFVDSYFLDDGLTYHSVRLDDQQGGYEIAKHLLSMGHRNIVFLANDTFVPGTDHSRFLGCQQAFKEQGLTFDTDRFFALSRDRDERKALYAQLVTDGPKYTAFVFSADYYAAEAVTYLQEIGVSIPDQISITGFDDNIFSRLVRPRLTTVHQDVFMKGQLAVTLLTKFIRGESVEEPEVWLPVRVEVRDSVRRLD
jgi:LacI family transcriptional regulator